MPTCDFVTDVTGLTIIETLSLHDGEPMDWWEWTDRGDHRTVALPDLEPAMAHRTNANRTFSRARAGGIPVSPTWRHETGGDRHNAHPQFRT